MNDAPWRDALVGDRRRRADGGFTETDDMREDHFEDGKWWVSPYNFIPEVRRELALPERVEIHDATFRFRPSSRWIVPRWRPGRRVTSVTGIALQA